MPIDKLVARDEITMAYLFLALRARLVVKSVEYKTVVHETVVKKTILYQTMVDESVVDAEMPMFSIKMVSLLQHSNPDLVMNERPAVAVVDLSASVDTLLIALQCYLVRPDFIKHRLQL